MNEDDLASRRARMVQEQIRARGVSEPRVLEAMRKVPRHRFVPERLIDQAYEDHPLPIGGGQTISQPYIVAAMTDLLEIKPGDRVLEIGTGSGYQAAVLAELAAEVYSIEILPELAERARALLSELGYSNVQVRAGDGYQGWPEAAPFDGIIVTAAPPKVPPALEAQLAAGARLVIPVGSYIQNLRVIERTEEGLESETHFGVRFVPMTGEAEERGED